MTIDLRRIAAVATGQLGSFSRQQAHAAGIVGPLWCAGNEPPPVNNAQPNDVTGPKSGQCSAL